MKKIIMMAFVVVLALTVASCSQETAVEVLEEKITSVEVMSPQAGSIVNDTSIVGKLEAKSTAVAMVQLSIPEEILEVRYVLGDYVEKDEIIVILDSESTDDQVENARLSYQTAVRNYSAAQESVNNGKANLVRTQSLYDAGVVSKQQLEVAVLQASDGQLKTLANQVNQAKFAYENAQKTLDNTTVVAPISGIISTMNFEENNLATSQNTLVITDMSSLEVNINITEDVLNKITDSTFVTVTIESTGDMVESEIKSVNPVANVQTGLYGMTVSLDNASNLYKPGMFARVKISFTGDETIIIPIDSVLKDEDGYYVYTIKEDTVIKTMIEIGEDDGEIIEVLSGLTSEDQLVVSGQNYITESSKIRVVLGGQ